MRSRIAFRFANVLAVVGLWFAAIPAAPTDAAAAHDRRYMPDPANILQYAHYEGISTKEFSHLKNGEYVWTRVYSYGEQDQTVTEVYHEDKNGLVMSDGSSILKLVYPLKIGSTWSYVNGQGKKVVCTVVSLNETVKTKAGTFKNVVKVKENDGRYQYYAQHLGLIKSENPSLVYGDPDYIELIAIKKKTAVMWDNTPLKKGQIGRITIVKPVNLWKRDEHNGLRFVRILKPGERYRVYAYDRRYGGQYSVGGGDYITKIPAHIRYETPSKKLLHQLKELYAPRRP